MQKILRQTIEVQLSKDTGCAKAFIEKYSDWGELHQYVADTLQRLGIKPYKEIRTYF